MSHGVFYIDMFFPIIAIFQIFSNFYYVKHFILHHPNLVYPKLTYTTRDSLLFYVCIFWQLLTLPFILVPRAV